MTQASEKRNESHAELKLHNTIIYLLGVPAVGKYTVAKEIGRMTGARVVDNQLINIPVFSVVGYDGKDSFPFPPGASKHIETIRSAVLAVIRNCCPPDDSFVFTNVLDAKDPGAREMFRRIQRLAKHRKAGFFPIWLTCDAATLRRRKDSPDRRARFKDTDLTSITWWLEEFEVFKVEHRNALTLNSADFEPQETAGRILEHIGVARGGEWAAHGAQSLARAYGDNEPEYTTADLKPP